MSDEVEMRCDDALLGMQCSHIGEKVSLLILHSR